MARKISSREKAILVAAAVLIVFAAWSYLRGGTQEGTATATAAGANTDGSLFVDREQLKIEETNYEKNKAFLGKTNQIEQGFRTLEKKYNISERDDRSFMVLLEQNLTAPPISLAGLRIEPAEYALLYESAEDYGDVKHKIGGEADLEKVGRMLNFFNSNLIRVHELHLHSDIGNSRIRVDAIVAQMVKLSPEAKKKLQKSRRKTTRPASDDNEGL